MDQGMHTGAQIGHGLDTPTPCTRPKGSNVKHLRIHPSLHCAGVMAAEAGQLPRLRPVHALIPVLYHQPAPGPAQVQAAGQLQGYAQPQKQPLLC